MDRSHSIAGRMDATLRRKARLGVAPAKRCIPSPGGDAEVGEALVLDSFHRPLGVRVDVGSRRVVGRTAGQCPAARGCECSRTDPTYASGAQCVRREASSRHLLTGAQRRRTKTEVPFTISIGRSRRFVADAGPMRGQCGATVICLASREREKNLLSCGDVRWAGQDSSLRHEG